jgi:hypothetical protein
VGHRPETGDRRRKEASSIRHRLDTDRKPPSQNLKDRTARSRLKARRKPYWREIEPNLAVGYRRLKGRKGAPAGAGTWSARHYVGGGAYTNEKIDGVADDFSDANGVTVLDFKQAQDKARALHLKRHTASEMAGPLTVKAALELHLEHLAGLGQNIASQRQHANAFILPALGDVEVAKLTAAQLRRFHHGLAKSPPRVRTKTGAPPAHREIDIRIPNPCAGASRRPTGS